MEHELRELADFGSYWRYYCWCGAVGGRCGTEEEAKASFTRHSEE